MISNKLSFKYAVVFVSFFFLLFFIVPFRFSDNCDSKVHCDFCERDLVTCGGVDFSGLYKSLAYGIGAIPVWISMNLFTLPSREVYE